MTDNATNSKMRFFWFTGYDFYGICGKRNPPVGGLLPSRGFGFRELQDFRYKSPNRGAEPRTVAIFGSASILLFLYFAATNGDSHLEERSRAIGKLVNLHDGRPSDFSIYFAVATWRRTGSDYIASRCEGIRRIPPNST